MDKFVMMKKMNGARVRTKDLWGVQIHGGKYYIYCNRKPICYGAWINAVRDLETALRRNIC